MEIVLVQTLIHEELSQSFGPGQVPSVANLAGPLEHLVLSKSFQGIQCALLSSRGSTYICHTPLNFLLSSLQMDGEIQVM